MVEGLVQELLVAPEGISAPGWTRRTKLWFSQRNGNWGKGTMQETMDISWSKTGSDNIRKSFVTVREVRQWIRSVHRGWVVSIPIYSHNKSQKKPWTTWFDLTADPVCEQGSTEDLQGPTWMVLWSYVNVKYKLHHLKPWRFHPTYAPA